MYYVKVSKLALKFLGKKEGKWVAMFNSATFLWKGFYEPIQMSKLAPKILEIWGEMWLESVK